MKTSRPTGSAEDFYGSALAILAECQIPFMVGGAYAMRHYADVVRDTKDLDVFCKTSDHARLLHALIEAGYATEITDATWLAKVFHGDHLLDLIFGSRNNVCPVDDSWFEHAPRVTLMGCEVLLVAPEEVLWTKALVQDRDRFDGADVMHLLRRQGRDLDWRRLLLRMEPHWEVLLAHLIQFRWIYPAERDTAPMWVMEELLAREQAQLTAPVPVEKICRGPLLSKLQYQVDIEEWGYRER